MKTKQKVAARQDDSRKLRKLARLVRKGKAEIDPAQLAAAAASPTTAVTAPAAPDAPDGQRRTAASTFDALERFGHSFVLKGNVVLDACPVCESMEIAELWRLPQSRVADKAYLSAPGTPMDGTYLYYLPTLITPQEVYRFDICAQCESIFLNPKDDDQARYVTDISKVAKFRREGPGDMKGAAQSFLALLPEGARTVVDAACGAGQVLHLMREARPELKYIGLELSKPSVEFMNDELGIEAYAVDLDRDDLDHAVPPGTADFIIFQEAYEHVRDPIVTMRKLVRMLRPGGRIHFTAQYYGDNPLQIRVGEPIYINQKGLDYTLDTLGLEMIKLVKDIKIRATVTQVR